MSETDRKIKMNCQSIGIGLIDKDEAAIDPYIEGSQNPGSLQYAIE